MQTLNAVKTRAICRIPLVGCLQKAEEYQSLQGNWQPTNDEQMVFMRHVDLAHELSVFNKDEFDSIASTSAEEINKWLSDNGFTLRCPDIKDGFATASFVKIFVNWLDPGVKSAIKVNDTLYTAVNFEHEEGRKIHQYGSDWGVTCISTQERGTKVFCAMRVDNMEADFDTLSDEQLLDIAEELESNYSSARTIFEGIKIPMLDMNMEVSHDWMSGIRNGKWHVDQCVQQFILKLNECGATAKSAAAMLFKRGSLQDTTLVFNKPFLLWFSRDGLTYPAFLAVCGTDCWKEPADLD